MRHGAILEALRSGQAVIEGQSCDGSQWPEGRHYWIVSDLRAWRIVHLPVDEFPELDAQFPSALLDTRSLLAAS